MNVNGEYRLMSGNDVGALLLNYILDRRTQNGTLPKDPIAVKTIVTTELCAKIAEEYGCELIDVLTGFKFIGEQIGELEKKGEENRYVFGFEESYGYLAGSYVRDKDAVVASMLICEMTAYYKTLGATLCDVLDNIYRRYGYYYCSQKSFTCEGQSGMEKISGIMNTLRSAPPKEINKTAVEVIKDFEKSESTDIKTGEKSVLTLPKSNVLGYYLADGSSLIVRPSGTEPKIKMYLSAVGSTADDASGNLAALEKAGTELLGF